MKNKTITGRIKSIVKKSRTIIILYHIVHNWMAKRKFESGETASPVGIKNAAKLVSDSLEYLNLVFDDYLEYSGVSTNDLNNKRILEIGPGRNFGVALKFLVAGAKQVVCLDKYLVNVDEETQIMIYRDLREQMSEPEKEAFDSIIKLESGIDVDEGRLKYIYGTALENADSVLEAGSFDFIVSRHVLEHLHNIDDAFPTMDKLLAPGGYMIHKIDFRDHGMFSSDGLHPLTFLTISESVYKLMTSDSGKPNRKLTDYYQGKMEALGYDTKVFIADILEVGDLKPYKEKVELGVDYHEASVSLVKEIRPNLIGAYSGLKDEDLMVAGIFVVGRKP